MKKYFALKSHSILYRILAIFLLLSSCTTYKHGYLGALPSSGSRMDTNVDSVDCSLAGLQYKKQELNTESFNLSRNIRETLNQSKPISAHTFNLLFDNLQKHYQIDTLYHLLMQQSHEESVRTKSKEALLESAVNYKKAFQGNKFIRRTINRGDPAFGVHPKTLIQAQQFLWSSKNNRKYLIEHQRDEMSIHTKSGFLLSKEVDNCHAAQYQTTYFFSRLFGNFAGLFHGRIDKKTNAMLLKSQLKEFDLVFLKSLSHLTEKFIPGYFGHVGISLGNNMIIEAPRCGVKISDTEEFSNGEIYLIVRPINLSNAQSQNIRNLLYRQIGKKYDFNFDSQSPDKVVCTELVSLAYDYIDWETRRVAGRYTTTPDDLIRTLMGRRDFEFEMYIKKGQFISKPDSTFISGLLKLK